MTPGESPFEKYDVDPTLQPQLRLYRRLWLARTDLDEAEAIVDEILRLNLPRPRKERAEPLLIALTTALVVTYARPFVNSRQRSAIAEKSVPGSLLRVLTKYQRSFHDVLLEIRNQQVAHSDAEAMRLSLHLYHNRDSAVVYVTRDPFSKTDLRELQRMIKKLLREIHRRCHDLRMALPQRVWI